MFGVTAEISAQWNEGPCVCPQLAGLALVRVARARAPLGADGTNQIAKLAVHLLGCRWRVQNDSSSAVGICLPRCLLWLWLLGARVTQKLF